MKETILGIDQKRAVELGLDVVDVVLLDAIKTKHESGATEKKEIDGEQYVWVSYKNLIEWLPILGLKKRSLALRLDKLAGKGILKKHIDREKGNFTFFALCNLNDIPMPSELQRVCNSNSIPMSTQLQTKRYRNKESVIREKEKDNNKLLSKKKEDFGAAFEEFMSKAVDDGNFKYSLRGYHIKDYTALLVAFRTHVTNLCKQHEFIDNGYVRNRSWLLRSMPYLDLSEATSVTLGPGEYMRDNRRWYRNPAGRECEVPIDAPPRQLRDQIWYANEMRWGPNV